MVNKLIDKNNIYNKPSFYAQIISGLIIIYCIYLYATVRISNYENLMVLLLFTISIGLHGLAHLFIEVNYNWNPLENAI